MQGNLAACLDVTLKHEGGYSNDRRDPGNWTGGKVGVGALKGTKYGIAAASYPRLDIKNMTVADARNIYAVKYWEPVRGDLMPLGVDLSVFDYGVNSGPSRSVKALQRVLGVVSDGKIGGGTVDAVTKADGKAVIQKHCASRMSFLRGLATWKTFKGGWSRRVAEIEAKAVVMWMTKGAPITHADRMVLEEEADKAKATAGKQTTGAGTAAGGGTAATGGSAVVTGEPNWLLIAAVVVVTVAVTAALIVKARHNQARAAAYRAAAKEG